MQYHEIGKTGMKISSLSFGASSLEGVFHISRSNIVLLDVRKRFP